MTTAMDMVKFLEMPLPSIDDMKKALLVVALAECDGSYVEAAKLLGLPHKTVYNWKKRLLKNGCLSDEEVTAVKEIRRRRIDD